MSSILVQKRRARCQRPFRVSGRCGFGRTTESTAWMPALDQFAMAHGCFYEDGPRSTHNKKGTVHLSYTSCWFPDVSINVAVPMGAYTRARRSGPDAEIHLWVGCVKGVLSPQKRPLRAYLRHEGRELLVEEEGGHDGYCLVAEL
jgi:hypothetical protein